MSKNLQYGKEYTNDYGKTQYSKKIVLEGKYFGKINEKFGKKSIGYNLEDEDEMFWLNSSGIKTYKNDYGVSCYISLKDNEIPTGNEFVIKKFTDKKGNIFCSLIPSFLIKCIPNIFKIKYIDII